MRLDHTPTAVVGPGGASEVAALYDRKTRSILEKYGPGPRVHYHTGLVDDGHAACCGSREALRAAMTRAQDALLEHVRDRARRPIVGRVLDVGCGLGGGTLFWAAQHPETRVVAITIAPDHVPVVERLARVAGLETQIEARLFDAHEGHRLGPFDHAVAIESVCYFDRPRWARSMWRALSPGGGLHIADVVAANGADVGWFDARWKTRVGSREEYVEALASAGFEEIEVEDLSHRAAGFWTLSVAWLGEVEPGSEGDRTARAHEHLREAMRTGELQHVRISARRGDGRP